MCQYLEFSSEKQLEELYKSYNATEDSIQRDVKTLIEWLDKHPYLPKVKDEELLKNFLLRGENSLEKTKHWLDVYYSARAEMPEVFQNRDLNQEDVDRLRNFGIYVPTPRLTADSYRVVIFHCPSSNKRETPNQEALLKAAQMALDVSIKTDRIRGMIIIFDFENMSLQHVTTFFPILKKILSLQTEITPINFHKIYLVNLISVAEPLVNYSKNVIGKDLAKKIEIWKKSAAELSDVIPAKCLPQEYGGTEKPMNELADQWFKYMLQFRDWFLAEESIKADLTKKPPSEKEKDADLGVSGSFRKLAVD